MIHPDIEQFKGLLSKGNLVPVYREILGDVDTPVSAFLKLGGDGPSFLLESVEGGERWARYSFLGLQPSKVIKSTGRAASMWDAETNAEQALDTEDPIEFLRGFMSQYRPVQVEGVPRFFGGLVGYMSYDMVRFMEKLPDKGLEGTDMPDMFFMLADTMLIFDSLRQTIKIVSNVHADGTKDPEDAYNAAVIKIDEIVQRLRQPVREGEMEVAEPPAAKPPGDGPDKDFTSTFGSKEDFKQAVLRAKEYVMAGDVVQVVLSQRFEKRSSTDPFTIYRALRLTNPSPYMFYYNTGDMQVVGSSPEILVRLEGRDITLRPIAGTRPRGKTKEEDLALEAELKADPKEIAEHIMLVDLGRNDVGRVAEIGSVKVSGLMETERYSHVMHMCSNVEGKLKDGLDSFDVLRACFPAGTVSGAPKIRAMEIIEELEPSRRGPYAGALGYFSYSGNMDTCITIRTLIHKDGVIYAQAGAGIVADSVPEKEYEETLNKAMAMMKAVDRAEKGLLRGGSKTCS